MAGRRFEFEARLERAGTLYCVKVPAPVSRAIGKWGPVPIVALVNGLAEVHASLVPTGSGRHRLQLNARTRGQVGANLGDRLAIALSVDENPMADPTPRDLARALEEEDLGGVFDRLPVGKRNHILHWIDEAVAPATRARRIVITLEVALRAREKEHDRAQRRRSRR